MGNQPAVCSEPFWPPADVLENGCTLRAFVHVYREDAELNAFVLSALGQDVGMQQDTQLVSRRKTAVFVVGASLLSVEALWNRMLMCWHFACLA